MAVTKIWAIRGRLDHVLNYAKNEEKLREADPDADSIDFADPD